MSLTVVSEPGKISLSKNPAEFHLRSDAYVTQQPVAGVYDLTFLTKLTAGAFLTLTWNGNTVTFYVQVTTTPSGFNLPDDITSTTLGQYVAALASVWFPANYLLHRDFIITDEIGPLVRFTAREPGTELQLSWSTDIPALEAVMSTNTTAVAWSLQDEYGVIMDIEVEENYGSGDYVRIGTLHETPVLYDDAGTWKGDVKFNVADVLDGFLQDKQDDPALNETIPTISDQTLLKWRAVYAERYLLAGLVPRIERRVQSSDKYVQKGGLDYTDVATVGDVFTNHYQAANPPFNTWQPQGKKVTAEETHYLTWFTDHVLSGLERFQLKATVYYTDGTTDNATLMSTDVQNAYEKFRYRTGFNDESLDTLQPSKTPTKYDVWIEDTTATITSETFTFYLEDSTPQDRYFMFENSFGDWETIRTNGEHVATINVVSKEAARHLEAGYSAEDAVVQKRVAGFTDSFTVFTGFKSKAEITHLRELLKCEKAYEITGGTKVPIIIESGRHELEYNRTGQYTFGLRFRYRHAFVNNGYSNS